MESEPRIENLFYLSDKLFNLAKDIIKNPFDHNIIHTKTINDLKNKQKYEIYNNFIGYLMENITRPNVKSQIEIESWKESIKVDEENKDDALHNIKEVFKRGHNKGFDFFQNNRKDYYYGIMPKSKDDFIDDFVNDLNNDEFGFYDDKKMTFQKYIGIIPQLFNEQAMFNFGFVNGAYGAFTEFTISMPYSVKNKVFDYIESLKTSNKKDNESIKHPFKDDNTLDLFNYIVDNWDYDKQQKWADIWNELNLSDHYIAPYQNEYKAYIIKRFNYTGKFQFDKVKKANNRHKEKLTELITEFSKK